MGTFVRHEPCPACGSRNNLARYDDGSAWCFGCHYKERRTQAVFNQKETKSVTSSDDLCNDFPGHVVEWLARYDVSVAEALKHGWKYSPRFDQLVFNFCDEEGNVLVSQARNFRAGAKTKYFNQGSPADVLPIFFGPTGGRSLVIVEDAVSAAKIARQCDAMPCLGSYLPAKKLARLRPFYEFLVIWLDADKLREAREMAYMAKWIGFSTKVVHTELDPKEYSNDEIAGYLK
jgi:hypothetical protein